MGKRSEVVRWASEPARACTCPRRVCAVRVHGACARCVCTARVQGACARRVCTVCACTACVHGVRVHGVCARCARARRVCTVRACTARVHGARKSPPRVRPSAAAHVLAACASPPCASPPTQDSNSRSPPLFLLRSLPGGSRGRRKRSGHWPHASRTSRTSVGWIRCACPRRNCPSTSLRLDSGRPRQSRRRSPCWSGREVVRWGVTGW